MVGTAQVCAVFPTEIEKNSTEKYPISEDKIHLIKEKCAGNRERVDTILNCMINTQLSCAYKDGDFKKFHTDKTEIETLIKFGYEQGWDMSKYQREYKDELNCIFKH